MRNSIKRFFSFASFMTITLFYGCATDQAAKVRAEKPATVGIWGGGYRPNGNIGLVTDLSGVVSAETDHKHFDSNGDIKNNRSDDSNSQDIKTRQSQKVDLALHLYPSQRSGFFYGLGASKRKNVTDFESPNVGSSLTNPSYSNVQVSDDVFAVGPSVGWDWIWPNGMSVLIDLGPRWDVSKNRKMTDAGDQESKIDLPQRDKLLKKIDNQASIRLVEPHLIVGYSF